MNPPAPATSSPSPLRGEGRGEVTPWIVIYRDYPIAFEPDPFRQMFRLVSRAEASTFPSRAEAFRMASQHNLYLDQITIEPLNP